MCIWRSCIANESAWVTRHVCAFERFSKIAGRPERTRLLYACDIFTSFVKELQTQDGKPSARNHGEIVFFLFISCVGACVCVTITHTYVILWLFSVALTSQFFFPWYLALQDLKTLAQLHRFRPQPGKLINSSRSLSVLLITVNLLATNLVLSRLNPRQHRTDRCMETHVY